MRLVVSKTSKQFGRFQIYGNRVVGQYALFVNETTWFGLQAVETVEQMINVVSELSDLLGKIYKCIVCSDATIP